MELFEWTDEIYVFSKVGEESDGITSVVEGDFIAIIVIFFLSLFVEQVLLQWNSFKNEKYEFI